MKTPTGLYIHRCVVGLSTVVEGKTRTIKQWIRRGRSRLHKGMIWFWCFVNRTIIQCRCSYPRWLSIQDSRIQRTKIIVGLTK